MRRTSAQRDSGLVRALELWLTPSSTCSFCRRWLTSGALIWSLPASFSQFLGLFFFVSQAQLCVITERMLPLQQNSRCLGLNRYLVTFQILSVKPSQILVLTHWYGKHLNRQHHWLIHFYVSLVKWCTYRFWNTKWCLAFVEWTFTFERIMHT